MQRIGEGREEKLDISLTGASGTNTAPLVRSLGRARRGFDGQARLADPAGAHQGDQAALVGWPTGRCRWASSALPADQRGGLGRQFEQVKGYLEGCRVRGDLPGRNPLSGQRNPASWPAVGISLAPPFLARRRMASSSAAAWRMLGRRCSRSFSSIRPPGARARGDTSGQNWRSGGAVLVGDLVHQGVELLALERGLASQHLKQEDAERPDIAARVQLLPAQRPPGSYKPGCRSACRPG